MSATRPTSAPADEAAARAARFRAVYDAAYDDLLRFAQRRMDPHRVEAGRAEDVVAEVFLVAWRRLDDVPADLADARPWLFGVARATLLNQRRGERRRAALAVRIAQAAPVPGGDAGDRAVLRLDLAAAWARLSPAEQEVISLSVWEGLDSARAGAVLGCTATAYRLRLSRARRTLRRHLDGATTHETRTR